MKATVVGADVGGVVLTGLFVGLGRGALVGTAVGVAVGASVGFGEGAVGRTDGPGVGAPAE
jgi:hypothetical protein